MFLTNEEVREIGIIFRTFDADGSGNIEVAELKNAMKALGMNKSKEELKEIMENADKDGSGDIDLQEFKVLMADMMKKRPIKDELKKVFRIYDDDDNGFIEFDNLRTVADTLAEEAEDGPTVPIDDDSVRNMILVADRKGKGVVDLDDFLYVMEEAGLFDEAKEAELKA